MLAVSCICAALNCAGNRTTAFYIRARLNFYYSRSLLQISTALLTLLYCTLYRSLNKCSKWEISKRKTHNIRCFRDAIKKALLNQVLFVNCERNKRHRSDSFNSSRTKKECNWCNELIIACYQWPTAVVADVWCWLVSNTANFGEVYQQNKLAQ